jgi:hypothetical protein
VLLTSFKLLIPYSLYRGSPRQVSLARATVARSGDAATSRATSEAARYVPVLQPSADVLWDEQQNYNLDWKLSLRPLRSLEQFEGIGDLRDEGGFNGKG